VQVQPAGSCPRPRCRRGAQARRGWLPAPAACGFPSAGRAAAWTHVVDHRSWPSATDPLDRRTARPRPDRRPMACGRFRVELLVPVTPARRELAPRTAVRISKKKRKRKSRRQAPWAVVRRKKSAGGNSRAFRRPAPPGRPGRIDRHGLTSGRSPAGAAVRDRAPRRAWPGAGTARVGDTLGPRRNPGVLSSPAGSRTRFCRALVPRPRCPGVPRWVVKTAGPARPGPPPTIDQQLRG